MRALMIMTGAMIGAGVGVFGAVFLISALRAEGGGGPAWEFTLLSSLGGLCALVFAVLAGWVSGTADTNRLAVAPTRHLLTLAMTLVGAAAGLGLFVVLALTGGGLDALAPQAAKVFAGALMLFGGLAGLGIGRVVAIKAYY